MKNVNSLFKSFTFGKTSFRTMSSGIRHREDFHSTTVLTVRKGNQVAMMSDGQISLGPTVFKNTAKKVRRISDNVVCGFAGSAADCLALMELLEKEFEKYPG